MATALSSLLPKPVHSHEDDKPATSSSLSSQKQSAELAARSAQQLSIVPVNKIPPYGSRKGWVPSKPEDYGDGGA